MANFASCALTEGLSLDCLDSQGGIRELYLFTGDGGEITFTLTSGSDCEIASIEEDGVAIPTASWYKFQTPKQTSSYTENIVVSPENGTVVYEEVITFIFNKLQCAVRDQILLLAKNTRLIAIVRDNNDNYWTCGILRGAEVTAGTSETGVSYSDRSGYSLTITGREAAPMYSVDPATVLGL